MAVVSPNFFFADPVRYSKKDDSVFSKDEKNHYDALGQITAPEKIFVYANHELSTSGMYIKGFAAGFLGSTRLGRFFSAGTAELLNPRWFGQAMVFHIPGRALPSQMQESDMKQMVFSLRDSISGANNASEREAYADALFKSLAAAQSNGGKISHDPMEFPSSLASSSHFAGLFKKKDISLAEGGAPADYFLAVHCDSGLVGRKLNQFAKQHPDMTLDEFLHSPQYQHAKHFSSRNTMRVAALLADALALDRSMVERRDDPEACPMNDFRAVPEMLSQPYAISAYNLLHKPIPNGDTVVYYNNTVRLAGQEYGGERIVQLKNAKSGITLLDVDPQRDYSVSRKNVIDAAGDRTGTSFVVSQPNPYAAFPLGTGRHSNKTSGFAELTEADARFLNDSYSWSKRSTAGDFKSTAHRSLYGYRRVDSLAKSTQKFILGAGGSKLDLEAVAVILGEQPQA